MTVPRPEFVRVSDAPAVYGMDRSTVYRWAEKGVITIYRRGRMSWVKASEMSHYIETGLGDQPGDQKDKT
ncbi:hypothetical protein LX81_00247 [Palleronia aestuarii]|uniref:Excisionase family DNA binding protein n=1 Tax=Palleronia aestuarii TaxID=568105 RepID=A0A2W7NH99_9RHOB|nr:helix-turn-helix domain-containing protein [Palleronia aestuarii]PZX19785.1 hypothetical protein LX81_00247 [Palleronia aestuarii]